MNPTDNSTIKRTLQALSQSLHLSVSYGDTGHQRLLTPRLWQALLFLLLALALLGWGLFHLSYAVSQQSMDPRLASEINAKNTQISALKATIL